MDDADVERYLCRIGLEEQPHADLAGLRRLMTHHLVSVPFENLSIHLGEPIELDVEALFDKLVRRRRGGFCYELNGAFAWLLRRLGFEVTLLAARVHTSVGLTAPFDHLTLRVDLDEPWLVDVGFGRFVEQPVRLAERSSQTDPAGPVRVVPAPYGDLDVEVNREPQIRLEPHPRELAEFVPTCWYHQTSPDSHFTRSMTCSLPSPGGRTTLAGRRLIRTAGDQRSELVIEDDGALLAAYRDEFGIVLDRLPVLRHGDPRDG